jgi:hypothetical protein
MIKYIIGGMRLAADYGFANRSRRNPYCHPIAESFFGVARVPKEQGIIREKVDWVFDERLMEQGKFFRCGKPRTASALLPDVVVSG